MFQQSPPGMLIQKLEGKVKQSTREYVVDKEASTPEKKRYMMKDGEKLVDAGYLITFPLKGHAIRVDEAEMLRLRSRFENANGIVEAEDTGVDLTAVHRAAGGRSLVTVIQEGAK